MNYLAVKVSHWVFQPQPFNMLIRQQALKQEEMHSGIQLHNLSLVSHTASHPKISQGKANTLRVKSGTEICFGCELPPKQLRLLHGQQLLGTSTHIHEDSVKHLSFDFSLLQE